MLVANLAILDVPNVPVLAPEIVVLAPTTTTSMEPAKLVLTPTSISLLVKLPPVTVLLAVMAALHVTLMEPARLALMAVISVTVDVFLAPATVKHVVPMENVPHVILTST